MTQPALLVTIGPSHYCEKARWALDRLGIAFREEKHAPVTHFPALMRRRAGFTTPVLVIDGRAIGDSTAILRHLDTLAPPELRLFPDDPAERLQASALESFFDEELAPETRRWVYSWALEDHGLLFTTFDPGLSRREAAVFHRFAGVAGWAVRQRLMMGSDARDRSLARIREVFRLVDTMLEDGRTRLVGDRFTVADLALAALGAPAVLPPAYGSPLPTLDELPPGMVRCVEDFRETATGRLILRLYEEERMPAPVAAAA